MRDFLIKNATSAPTSYIYSKSMCVLYVEWNDAILFRRILNIPPARPSFLLLKFALRGCIPCLFLKLKVFSVKDGPLRYRWFYMSVCSHPPRKYEKLFDMYIVHIIYCTVQCTSFFPFKPHCLAVKSCMGWVLSGVDPPSNSVNSRCFSFAIFAIPTFVRF